MNTSPGPKNTIQKLSHKRIGFVLLLIIFIFAFSVRYVNLMDAGITWDEPDYVQAGIIYIDNLQHLKFDSNAFIANDEHPPVAKYLYGLAIWAFNSGNEDFNAYIVARTVSVILGALTCAILFLIGKEFFSMPTAFLSALILALMPDFVAHTQIATLDGPTAFFFTLTMYLFMMALKNNSKGYYFASAISLGLLADTKFTGFLILPIMALLFIVWRYLTKNDTGVKLADQLRHYLPLFILYALISTGVAIIIYPWIWGGFDHIMLTIDHWTLWSNTPTEYFLGTMQQAPIYYYPVYFLATTPALLFIPIVIGVYVILRSRDPYKLAILLWLIVPFAYSLSSFKQNGMRYILMIYPALALIIGYGLEITAEKIVSYLNQKSKTSSIFFILGAVTVVYLIITLSSVSPYYLDYYNGLIGGPSNVKANNLLEFGWWGEGLYDPVMYIEHNAPPNSTVYLDVRPSHTVDIYPKNATYITSITENTKIDYVIYNAMNELYQPQNFTSTKFRLVHVTTVEGVPISKVYKNAN